MATLTPDTITHASNVPTFYQQKEQFLHMLKYLFAKYNSKFVWMQVPSKSYSNLAIQLHKFVESLDTQQKLFEIKDLFFHSYYVIVKMTRNYQSVTQWMATQPPEFLTAMHKMYRILISIRQQIPPLPLFGHPYEKLNGVN